MTPPTIHEVIRDGDQIVQYVVSAQEFRRFVLSIQPKVTIDEEAYLADNPDVAAAIELGAFKTATEHYLQFGYFEGRPAVPPSQEE
ncbi:hypothetical protein [Aquibium oceanicum]|uniref:Uncharacterized protein n=1 Tax=Aquibium oceanicum TaxID=1670800 RepID=A0A1L3SRD3_9HYPH|nr:hypothetical protein [Aquibium oceanicum]APH71987.1 hypothetical protein BSQ44_11900 [Aquibium oceanicum]